MPQISVIVPVYNAEKYLHRCIDSILAQTFTDFELLLIDDGSKDSSGLICDEYEARDTRVRAIHKENGGVSSARNVGLEVARGEWIVFADSDDWIEEETLQEIVDCIRNSTAEYFRFGYIKEFQNGERKYYLAGNGNIATHDEIFKLCQQGGYFGFLWNSVFNRTVIGELRFDESLCWLEDQIFSFNYLRRINKAYFIGKTLYHYTVQDSGSLSSIRDPFMILRAGVEQYRSLNVLEFEDEYNRKEVVRIFGHHQVKAIKAVYESGRPFKERRLFYHLYKQNPTESPASLFLNIYRCFPFIIVDTAFMIKYHHKK